MKKIFSIFLIAAVCCGFITAQTESEAVEKAKAEIRNAVTPHLQKLAGEIGAALPDNAVIGSTWSDAYIGQLIGIPPHFGVGVSAGVTKLSVSSLRGAIDAASGSGALSGFIEGDNLVLPTYNIAAKIGGIILPFDFGVRLSYVPQVDKLLWTGLSFNYLLAGADLRFNLLESGIICPDVSIGASFTYLGGNIGYSADDNNSMTVDYRSYILEISAQVSKSFIIVTPYAGVGCIMDWTNIDITTQYNRSYTFSGTNSSTPVTVADKFSTGYSHNASELSGDFFTARVFGGLSLNLAIVKIDLCGSYNFITENWGANIGARVQL